MRRDTPRIRTRFENRHKNWRKSWLFVTRRNPEVISYSGKKGEFVGYDLIFELRNGGKTPAINVRTGSGNSIGPPNRVDVGQKVHRHCRETLGTVICQGESSFHTHYIDAATALDILEKRIAYYIYIFAEYETAYGEIFYSESTINVRIDERPGTVYGKFPDEPPVLIGSHFMGGGTSITKLTRSIESISESEWSRERPKGEDQAQTAQSPSM